jgi:sulfur-oxidizing protein SoxA
MRGGSIMVIGRQTGGRRRRLASTAAASALVAVATTFAAADSIAPGHEVGGRRSGYLYLSEETRALQDDPFLNPGMFAVEKGRELWSRTDGAEGKSCATCHAAEEMRGAATRYPLFDPKRGGIVNLPLRINEMRTEKMQAAPLPYESPDMLALDAFISSQSRGMPIAVDVDGAAKPFFESGRAFYFQRRGQLNIACAQCHDDLAGQKLRGDTISQGQINGFPIYRLMWRSMASRHRMFEWCNTAVRAEPYAAGSPEYLALELYMAWRARGLPLESPAVRR